MTIVGQCVLLQNSLENKNFRFFLKPKLPYDSHLSRHTAEPLKKFVKILETRLQSSTNAPKCTKNCQIHDVDKSTLVFGFQLLFCVPS